MARSPTRSASPRGTLAIIEGLNPSDNWAVYFAGNVDVTGTGYYLNGVFLASDGQFKTNVQDLDDALEVVMQLQPHRYDFATGQYPQLDFPSGPQAGLLAQELEAAPQFYNTLTANCTTTVYGLARRWQPDLPVDWRLVLSGRLPDYLADLGVLDGPRPTADQPEPALITPRARAAPPGADFSTVIRTR